MDTEKSADRDAVKAKIEESQAAARELVKDATLLASQARVLRERAARTRAEAQRLRVQRAPAPGDTALLVTVSMPAASAAFASAHCEAPFRSLTSRRASSPATTGSASFTATRCSCRRTL